MHPDFFAAHLFLYPNNLCKYKNQSETELLRIN
jgi:hypothetical protein